MGNFKLLICLIIGVILGIAIHAYISESCREKLESGDGITLTPIAKDSSIVGFNRYMETKFAANDTVQAIRNDTRITRVEFSQETLAELNEINKTFGAKLPIRLYFGMNGPEEIYLMAMAFDASKGGNQTNKIFKIDGIPPTCPDVCDQEGPYEK